jgi:hypothetical protein
LPLRVWRPGAFNGTALVIGSIAPDFEYLLTAGPIGDGFPHSVEGQFLFCLPVTLTVVLLIGFFDLGAVLVSRTYGRGAWLVGAATDVVKEGGVVRASGSALIASFSHIAFDTFTHVWLPSILPGGTFHVRDLAFSSIAISQVGVSAASSIPALWLFRRVSREVPSTLPPARRGLSIIGALALFGAALGFAHCIPAIRRPDDYFEAGRFYVWGDVLFQSAVGAGVGMIAALVLLALTDRRASR